ncbi:hypothetical protein MICAG_1380006 [Microcystis aeruginosa PCC 9808]|uniref:Uncharacterized protein n=2 Tax=Microcystis aeruginosa TaxID=1126 RepID=I4HHI3_MICAE|nr:hypothetical protein MICAG_1380006 [Microcystis aeruginosa PCC 9808]
MSVVVVELLLDLIFDTQEFWLTGGQDISKRCPQRFLGSSVTNRYIPFSQKANERIRDLGELIRNLYQQWGVICIELFRSNTPKSLCCKEFSQLVPLSGILGILVEAKNRGLISEVKPLLDALIDQAGFWVAAPLYSSVLQIVDEEKNKPPQD